ncbi:BatA domain-containing protein [Sulfuriroseicoccus oceanibius]|uniref:BatA domain-containing protein n=1 Tax=Sulfuriroseicoccus oceanibius TaxID=2707525 RepID=A0A6B3LD04_9BACT|nr:BatA domain-containing protein [Sulfuriroseicoccus oceanibius]QQL43977.1 BatA domain-containing protein [Sulfuriroseicoccus oceanibius]
MQLLLANFSWLWLALLVALPVLVHLFARSNPKRFEFSDTAFLRRIVKKSARVRKPQDWLVLLLRTLAVAALVAAFLRPLLTYGDADTAAERHCVVVIDRSASMAGRDGVSSRFASACAQAAEWLASDDFDRVNVVWLDATPDAVFPQPGVNVEFLVDSIHRQAVSAEAGAIKQAVDLAAAQLSQLAGDRQLVVVSDFQKSAWQNVSLEVPAGVKLTKVAVGDSDLPNVAIDRIFCAPAEPVVGEDVKVVCKVHNYSDTPQRVTLFLEVNGGRQSQVMELAAWGEGEALFATRFSEPAVVPVRAEISEDAFSGDDVAHALIEVGAPVALRSVAHSFNEDAVQVLARLGSALEWMEHQVDGPGSFDGASDALWFVHGWDGRDAASLREAAEQGATVVVEPGVGCSLGAIDAVLGLTGGSRSAQAMELETLEGNSGRAADRRGWQAGIAAAGEGLPVFQLFRSGEFGNPFGGNFFERWRLPQEWPADLERLADYDDGVPALAARRVGSGYVILWNLALGSGKGTWSDQSVFVPLMGELLAGYRNRGVVTSHEVPVGGELGWVLPDGIAAESVRLVDDRGNELELRSEQTQSGVRMVAERAAYPARFQWMTGGASLAQNASSFPSSESDLRLVDPAGIGSGEVVDRDGLLQRAALGDGVDLWPWLVAAVLLLLVAEALVCLWSPGSRSNG